MDAGLFKHDKDLLNFRNNPEFNAKNKLLSINEMSEKFGHRYQYEEGKKAGKTQTFADPSHESIYNILRHQMKPYKKRQVSADKGHPMEMKWWKDLPLKVKEKFQRPTFATHVAINGFQRRLNKFYNETDKKYEKAYKKEDYDKAKVLRDQLNEVKYMSKELLLDFQLPSKSPLELKYHSPYTVGTNFQYKMRQLIEKQDDILAKLPQFQKQFEELKEEGKLFKKQGGMVGMDYLTRPI